MGHGSSANTYVFQWAVILEAGPQALGRTVEKLKKNMIMIIFKDS